MNEFKRLRKSVKAKAVSGGIVRRVADTTGKSRSAVSRTLWGRTDQPSPLITAALWRELASLGLLENEAA